SGVRVPTLVGLSLFEDKSPTEVGTLTASGVGQILMMPAFSARVRPHSERPSITKTCEVPMRNSLIPMVRRSLGFSIPVVALAFSYIALAQQASERFASGNSYVEPN